MIKSRWFFHPLFIFIFSLVAILTSLFIYIRSYLQVHQAFNELVIKYHINSNRLLESETWVIIVILSILVAIIMLGMMMIFIYYQKMIQLYRLQQNFINGFTHELKTPIASIQLFVDTFLKHELKRDEQIKYLEFMKRDAERLSQNVNRILHLAKLEDKKFQANFEEKNLVTVINRLLKNTPHLFENVEINFHHEREDVFFKLDVSLFEMLLMNLITNGIIYNKSNNKKIDIELIASEHKMKLIVRDNGIGIEKAEQKKIFKKFYQVGKATKGSGLGLYIVASIVKLHHGEIKVQSEGPAMGSQFIMDFKI